MKQSCQQTRENNDFFSCFSQIWMERSGFTAWLRSNGSLISSARKRVRAGFLVPVAAVGGAAGRGSGPGPEASSAGGG